MPAMSTTTWSQVFELARNLGAKKMQVNNSDAMICQFVAARMYTFRPWSWSLINMPYNSLPLVTGQQDYPAPEDMYDLTQAWLTITYPPGNGNPGSPDQNYNLEVVENLTPDLNPTGYVTRGPISYIANYGVLRLGNAIQTSTTNPSFLNATYQPKMEKVTDTSMPLPFPDEYSLTAAEGILYWLYKFGDDERAGTVVKQGNAVEYTGQLGVFEASLMNVAALDQASEVDTFFPSDAIGHRWNWGPYPYIWVS